MSAALAAMFGAGIYTAGAPHALAADVTYERLLNPEPQNWLSHHRDFTAQRHSPLNQINKSNAKNLKLHFAVAIGGTSPNEGLQVTPLVEDGFMYVIDGWGVVYKIDVRSGNHGRILWKMDPGMKRYGRIRGVALWGNLVISPTGKDGRIIATDKETGKIVGHEIDMRLRAVRYLPGLALRRFSRWRRHQNRRHAARMRHDQIAVEIFKKRRVRRNDVMLIEKALISAGVWLGDEIGGDNIENIFKKMVDSDLLRGFQRMVAGAIGQDQLAARQGGDRRRQRMIDIER